ncbi:hypothetical protein DFH09DRAFT_1320258 [Mycena vulgaris]|nr:hypothetical protein DFH09DRAFT_1320258 [Mycena vulgaris]
MKSSFQFTALLISFIAAVPADVIPRESALDARGCTLTLVCDGGIKQAAICTKQGYGCPDSAKKLPLYRIVGAVPSAIRAYCYAKWT